MVKRGHLIVLVSTCLLLLFALAIKPVHAAATILTVDKTADTPISKVGDKIKYTIKITNLGAKKLDITSVKDTLLGDITASFPDYLQPKGKTGDKATATFTYTVKASDSDPLVNTVTVKAIKEGATTTIKAQDSVSIDLVNPSASVTKTADRSTASVGDTIKYTITVKNTSPNVSLNNITVTDSLLGDLSASFANSLDPGVSESHTFNYVVKATDPDPLVNTVTVKGNPDGLPNVVTATDSASVTITSTPAGASIAIDKTANRATANVGDTIVYTITVTNTGNVTLNNISIVDSIFGNISTAILGATKTLTPGQSKSKTFAYVVKATDPNPLVNTVTATGTPAGSTAKVSASDSASVIITNQPAEAGIAVQKTANVSSAKVGDVITYTITVTNVGDVALTNLQVQDSLLGNLTSAFNGTDLAPGASRTKTVTYTVRCTDPNPLINTVTASALPAGASARISASDSASVTIVSTPANGAVKICKTADRTTACIGQTITYTITISNPGTVTLTGITVTDSLLGNLSAAFVDTLAPGASDTHSFPYTLQSCDPNPLVNVATVTATAANCGTVQDTASLSIPRGTTPTTTGVNFYLYDKNYQNPVGKDAVGGTKSQTTPKGTAIIFPLRVENKTGQTVTIKITGIGGNGNWKVQYVNARNGGSDITSQVVNGGWNAAITGTTFAPGAARDFMVVVTPCGSGLSSGASFSTQITATAVGTGQSDTVTAITTVQ